MENRAVVLPIWVALRRLIGYEIRTRFGEKFEAEL